MKQLYPMVLTTLLGMLLVPCTLSMHAEAIDSYDDGDFTSSPVWNGDAGNWAIAPSSDVAAGATNSNTLRLNAATGVAGTQSLSTQHSLPWGTSQSWSFWMGRRGQAATTTNYSRVFLYANESDLESATVDGYAVEFGDNLSGGDKIRLIRIQDGSAAATIITSSESVPNGLTDIGFMVRVTRTAGGTWSLYTSDLPMANGEGAVSTDEPSMSNTAVFQGSGSDNTISDFTGGYVGVAAIQTSGTAARAGFEFDQFFFAPSSDSPLPVELVSFSIAAGNAQIMLQWRTASEVHNLGFEILRRSKEEPKFTKIASYLTSPSLAGLGTSSSGRGYSFTDHDVDLTPGRTYFYRLVTVDDDGTRHEQPAKEITIEDAGRGVSSLFSLVVAPNPTAGDLHLRYTTPGDTPLRIALYTPTGERVPGIGDDGPYSPGTGEVSLATAGLPNGIYTLHVTSGLRRTTRQIVIVR